MKKSEMDKLMDADYYVVDTVGQTKLYDEINYTSSSRGISINLSNIDGDCNDTQSFYLSQCTYNDSIKKIEIISEHERIAIDALVIPLYLKAENNSIPTAIEREVEEVSVSGVLDIVDVQSRKYPLVGYTMNEDPLSNQSLYDTLKGLIDVEGRLQKEVKDNSVSVDASIMLYGGEYSIHLKSEYCNNITRGSIIECLTITNTNLLFIYHYATTTTLEKCMTIIHLLDDWETLINIDNNNNNNE